MISQVNITRKSFDLLLLNWSRFRYELSRAAQKCNLTLPPCKPWSELSSSDRGSLATWSHAKVTRNCDTPLESKAATDVHDDDDDDDGGGGGDDDDEDDDDDDDKDNKDDIR